MNVKISGTSEQDVCHILKKIFSTMCEYYMLESASRKLFFFSKRHLLKVHTRLQKHLHDDKYKGMT